MESTDVESTGVESKGVAYSTKVVAALYSTLKHKSDFLLSVEN